MNRDMVLFLIGRIHFKVDKMLRAELAGHGMRGLAPSHGEIIGVLTERGDLRMARLAEIIDKDKSTLTALVDKLEKLGYVCRRKDPEDSRVYWIRLTAKGRAMRAAVVEISARMRSRAYAALSAGELDRLYELLEKINRVM